MDGVGWVVGAPPWEPPFQTRGCAGPLWAGLSEEGGLGLLSLLLLDPCHSIPTLPFSLPPWYPWAELGNLYPKGNQEFPCPELHPQVLSFDRQYSCRWAP